MLRDLQQVFHRVYDEATRSLGLIVALLDAHIRAGGLNSDQVSTPCFVCYGACFILLELIRASFA